jgi:hypothetical protein
MTKNERTRDSPGDDLLHHAVHEILLLGITAHIREWQHCYRRLVGQRQRLASGLLDCRGGCCRLQCKSLDRAGDILQPECPKLFERQIEPVPDVIAHRPRDANATRRTVSLKSHRHIDSVAMQVRSIGYGVADIDPDAEADG